MDRYSSRAVSVYPFWGVAFKLNRRAALLPTGIRVSDKISFALAILMTGLPRPSPSVTLNISVFSGSSLLLSRTPVWKTVFPSLSVKVTSIHTWRRSPNPVGRLWPAPVLVTTTRAVWASVMTRKISAACFKRSTAMADLSLALNIAGTPELAPTKLWVKIWGRCFAPAAALPGFLGRGVAPVAGTPGRWYMWHPWQETCFSGSGLLYGLFFHSVYVVSRSVPKATCLTSWQVPHIFESVCSFENAASWNSGSASSKGPYLTPGSYSPCPGDKTSPLLYIRLTSTAT